MIKKTIKFDDLDGNEVTEDFYFNFTTAELAQMRMVEDGGLETSIKKIIASDDPNKIMDAFQDIIGRAIGRRSEDGKFLIKNKQISQEFLSSEAYSELFMEFMANSGSAVEFINGLMPRKLKAQVAAMQKTDVVELPNSGIIEGVLGDAEAQAEKPQPNFPERTSFPNGLEAAVQMNSSSRADSDTVSDEPAWLKELRNPTKKELMIMGREEMQLAMKMKANGVLT